MQELLAIGTNQSQQKYSWCKNIWLSEQVQTQSLIQIK